MSRLEQLLQFHESSPNDSFILFAIAKEHEKSGKSDQAMEWYLKLQQSNPDYVGLYYHLGKLYEGIEDFNKAVETYEQGMEVARKVGDQHALGELAGAKLNLDD